MTSNIKSTYEANIDLWSSKIASSNSILKSYVLYRLVAFGAWIGIFFIPFISPFYFKILIGLPVFALFLWLVKKNRNLKIKRDFERKMKRLNELEINVLNKDYSSFEDGSEFMDPSHQYSHDMDVFGDRSFFQYINRTSSFKGKQRLADNLSDSMHSNRELEERQAAVEELSSEVDFRQEIHARISFCDEDRTDLKTIINWLELKSKFKIQNWQKILMGLVVVYSATLTVMLSLELIHPILFFAIIVIPMIVPGFILKTITEEYKTLQKAFKSISKFHEVFDALAHKKFDSKVLSVHQSNFLKASQQLKELNKVVSQFDQRNNILVLFIMNIYFSWDLFSLRNLMAWKNENSNDLKNWFDSLADFEVISSLSNFRFNHQDESIYPELNSSGVYEFTGVGHPFIPSGERVDNDYSLVKNQFSIITGANMAGKSTFLRTIGVNMILAFSGGPVLAKKANLQPIKMFTSMRTSDSLQSQKSYFYTELLRLNLIVNELEKGQGLFIILDEILKGTNSKDKAEGSFKFMEKILTYDSTGIVATHDLSLCEIESKYPNQIENLFFDVSIEKDDLNFDYLLRNGVCSNMNATFLMKKMGLTN